MVLPGIVHVMLFKVKNPRETSWCSLIALDGHCKSTGCGGIPNCNYWSWNQVENGGGIWNNGLSKDLKCMFNSLWESWCDNRLVRVIFYEKGEDVLRWRMTEDLYLIQPLTIKVVRHCFKYCDCLYIHVGVWLTS